jgi:hypothetical protein
VTSHVSMAKQKRSTAAVGADTPAAKPPAKPKGPVDPRFAALQTDPRFERFPAPRKAVTIDERFAGEHLATPCMAASAPLGQHSFCKCIYGRHLITTEHVSTSGAQACLRTPTLGPARQWTSAAGR